MKPLEYRIQNFRSIVDTGWCRFSHDGVTVLVGQNESGKTSVLEALAIAFGGNNLQEDDIRLDAEMPVVSMRLRVSADEIKEGFDDYSAFSIASVNSHFSERQYVVEFVTGWSHKESGKYVFEINLIDPESKLQTLLAQGGATYEDGLKIARDTNPPEQVEKAIANIGPEPVSFEKAVKLLWQCTPMFNLFNDDDGVLPNEIDIAADFSLSGAGAVGAANFLAAAGIELKALVNAKDRAQTTTLERANEQLTTDFNTFWTQVIGGGKKLTLECQLKRRDATAAERSGQPYLVFWISDNPERLYPKQRSKGVKWFVSFFLQMRASQVEDSFTVFLLDEPGANLHAKAQKNVLALIENVRKSADVMYSTHSPYLLQYKYWFRISAVQRADDDETSPSIVIDAHSLTSASEDTLSPILTAMGEDLSHQQVVKARGNVLLEEISCHYYLSAFWKLTKRTEEAYFVAATGADNVPKMAYLFLAWGLQFIILLDDDSKGRTVYNGLKRDMYRDDQILASQAMIKLENCKGVEDIFDKVDFAKFVLLDTEADLAAGNADYMKHHGASKALMASRFLAEVDAGRVTWAMLGSKTQAKITSTVADIVKRL